jgi:phage-related protein
VKRKNMQKQTENDAYILKFREQYRQSTGKGSNPQGQSD